MLYLAVDSGMRPQEYLALPCSNIKDTGVEVDRALDGGGIQRLAVAHSAIVLNAMRERGGLLIGFVRGGQDRAPRRLGCPAPGGQRQAKRHHSPGESGHAMVLLDKDKNSACGPAVPSHGGV